MSDLAATNCGGNSCGCSGFGGFGDNGLLLILLLCCCGGNNGGFFGGGDNCNSGFDWIILLILLYGCGGNSRSGCGCSIC